MTIPAVQSRVQFNGWVAQLAEQWTENPRVGGSIPPPATSPFSWLKHEGKRVFFLRFQHPRMRRYIHAFFSRIGPVRKPCGSRSTCHCHMGLSNRSAVE